jgi:hypothetical protein
MKIQLLYIIKALLIFLAYAIFFKVLELYCKELVLES